MIFIKFNVIMMLGLLPASLFGMSPHQLIDQAFRASLLAPLQPARVERLEAICLPRQQYLHITRMQVSDFQRPKYATKEDALVAAETQLKEYKREREEKSISVLDKEDYEEPSVQVYHCPSLSAERQAQQCAVSVRHMREHRQGNTLELGVFSFSALSNGMPLPKLKQNPRYSSGGSCKAWRSLFEQQSGWKNKVDYRAQCRRSQAFGDAIVKREIASSPERTLRFEKEKKLLTQQLIDMFDDKHPTKSILSQLFLTNTVHGLQEVSKLNYESQEVASLCDDLRAIMYTREEGFVGVQADALRSWHAVQRVKRFVQEFCPENMYLLQESGILDKYQRPPLYRPDQLLSYSSLPQGVYSHSANMQLVDFMDLCSNGYLQQAHDMLQAARATNSSSTGNMQAIYNEAYAAFFNDFHIRRKYERDPMWPHYKEQLTPGVFDENFWKLDALLEYRDSEHDQILTKVGVQDNPSPLVESLAYDLVGVADPRIIADTLAVLSADSPHRQVRDAYNLYYDSNGLPRVCNYDAQALDGISMPPDIGSCACIPRRTLLTKLCTLQVKNENEKLVRQQAADYAIKACRDRRYLSLAETAYNALAYRHADKTIMHCGLFALEQATAEQEVIHQTALSLVSSLAAKINENSLSPEELVRAQQGLLLLDDVYVCMERRDTEQAHEILTRQASQYVEMTPELEHLCKVQAERDEFRNRQLESQQIEGEQNVHSSNTGSFFQPSFIPMRGSGIPVTENNHESMITTREDELRDIFTRAFEQEGLDEEPSAVATVESRQAGNEVMRHVTHAAREVCQANGIDDGIFEQPFNDAVQRGYQDRIVALINDASQLQYAHANNTQIQVAASAMVNIGAVAQHFNSTRNFERCERALEVGDRIHDYLCAMAAGVVEGIYNTASTIGTIGSAIGRPVDTLYNALHALGEAFYTLTNSVIELHRHYGPPSEEQLVDMLVNPDRWQEWEAERNAAWQRAYVLMRERMSRITGPGIAHASTRFMTEMIAFNRATRAGGQLLEAGRAALNTPQARGLLTGFGRAHRAFENSLSRPMPVSSRLPVQVSDRIPTTIRVSNKIPNTTPIHFLGRNGEEITVNLRDFVQKPELRAQIREYLQKYKHKQSLGRCPMHNIITEKGMHSHNIPEAVREVILTDAQLERLARVYDYTHTTRQAWGTPQQIWVDYKHILTPDIRIHCARGKIGLSGLHHDRLGKLKSSNLLQFKDFVYAPTEAYEAKWSLDGITFKRSTFFPDNWTPSQIIEKIYEAYNHPTGSLQFKSDKLIMSGKTLEGIEIEMCFEVLNKQVTGRLISAYPVIKME